MSRKLEGKVTLVTGGGSGIGKATALAFAREGTKVVVADIDERGGKDTCRLIKEIGMEAIFFESDASKSLEVEAMVKRTVEVYGRLDFAINNAGIEGNYIPLIDYPEEIGLKLLSINLVGVWFCMKYEIPQMLRQGGGAIVNVASVAGLIGAPGLSLYSASKHGVIGLTKTAALENAKMGIRINAVCPGVINTPITDRILSDHPEIRELFLGMHPIGRFGEPLEVAEAVVWLCSDSASFVTGSAMVIDGGVTAI